MGDNKNHENNAIRKSISLETKMRVIRRLDTSECQSHIGAALNLANSATRTILKNKEKILKLQLRQALQLELPVLEILQCMKWIIDFLNGLTTKLNAICLKVNLPS
ncbi:hypothetical protein TNCV_4526461 [Trichonephila clavipes]|nr:hypothetical protein TNCV_4526461 [Trichonephila clavipes]